jgi:glycosyltransferase involved in cell wall biosynthesis
MESAHPLLSVIVPVYNGDAFLAEAIDSVRPQRYEPLEILLIDDGSTDGERWNREIAPEALARNRRENRVGPGGSGRSGEARHT